MNRTSLVAVFSVFAALSVFSAGCAISSEPEPTPAPEPQKVGEAQKPAAPEGAITTQAKPGDGMTCTVHHGVTTCCDPTACVSF